MTRSLPEINADKRSEHAKVIVGINWWIFTIGSLWMCLGIWALDQAEQHYQQQDKVNQEVAWKR
jgi:hypothetical protein